MPYQQLAGNELTGDWAFAGAEQIAKVQYAFRFYANQERML